MKTWTASMSSMKRSCSASSLVQALDPSTKVVALAISMARRCQRRGTIEADRSEDLLGVEPNVPLVMSVDHRRWVEPARPRRGSYRPRRTLAPAATASSTCLAISSRPDSVASGPTSVVRVGWIADLERVHPLDELVHERRTVGLSCVHDETLGGDTGLAVVLPPGR